MKETIENNKIFVTFIITLIISVTFTVLGITFFADHIVLFFFFVAFAIILLGGIFIFIILKRETILKKLLNSPKVNSLRNIQIELDNAIMHTANKEYTKTLESIILSSKNLLALYLWRVNRNWMVNTLLGLFIGFGAILGSALIYKQNKLIKDQNEAILDQFILTQNEIEENNKHKFYNILYDSDAPTPLKVEALQYILNRRKKFKTRSKLNLYTIEMSNTVLDSIEFDNINFSNATFDKATLTDVTFSNSIDFLGTSFIGATLINVNFNSADLNNTNFKLGKLNKVNFSGAGLRNLKMNGAKLNDVDFSNRKLEGEFINSVFYKCNFTGCSLGESTIFKNSYFIDCTIDLNTLNLDKFEDIYISTKLNQNQQDTNKLIFDEVKIYPDSLIKSYFIIVNIQDEID